MGEHSSIKSRTTNQPKEGRESGDHVPRSRSSSDRIAESSSGSDSAPQKPDTLALGELAIAAGITGRSISLCFCDYDAPTLCAMWKNLVSSLDDNCVLQIGTRSELKDLKKNINRIRLVVVQKPQLYFSTNWMIQMKMDSGGTPLPAVFASFPPDDLDDDPAATLILRGSAMESTALSSWLMDSERHRVDWTAVQEFVARHSGESSIISLDSLDLRQHISQLRDLQIVQGLTAGACLLRQEQNTPQPTLPLHANLHDYERARSLLMSPMISATERSVDELASIMVSRSNVYLTVKNAIGESALNPTEVDDRSLSSRSKREPITRREIADLGNTKAGLVRRLIEHLQRNGNGYDLFMDLGLVGRPPRRDRWERQPASTLTNILRSWSPKQVRTHFVRLQHDRFITAACDRSNGALLYLLPESLAATSNRFASLPLATDIAATEE